MLAYGKGSVKKNGIYDELKNLLLQVNKEIVDFDRIMPNPTDTKVWAKERHVDFILAVGGGSVVDCCKVISAQTMAEEDLWIMEYERGKFPTVGGGNSFRNRC